MLEWTDIQPPDFCRRDFVRYRQVIHHLDPPCREWDTRMSEMYGGRGDYAIRLFVGSLEQTELVALVGDGEMLLEGKTTNVTHAELAEWCGHWVLRGVSTTHEPLKNCLSEALDIAEWQQFGFHTVTPDSFTERITCQVRRASADDRAQWERFLKPQVSNAMSKRGIQITVAAARDFDFMCAGLPVDCYVTREGEDITGVLTVNAFTAQVDEISAVFVGPNHRRKGLAHSLLSAATKDVFARGRQPAYAANSSQQELDRMLKGIGFHLVSHSWRGRPACAIGRYQHAAGAAERAGASRGRAVPDR